MCTITTALRAAVSFGRGTRSSQDSGNDLAALAMPGPAVAAVPELGEVDAVVSHASASTHPCQVPSTSLPFEMGSVIELPTSDVLRCETESLGLA